MSLRTARRARNGLATQQTISTGYKLGPQAEIRVHIATSPPLLQEMYGQLQPRRILPERFPDD